MPDREHPSRRRFMATAVAATAAMLSETPALAARRLRRGPAIAGRVVLRGEPGYEEWRLGMPWQRVKPNRFPDVIAQPADAEEIVRCLQFARRNGLRVAVKSGGHHVWANFLRNDGLLLDLSRLRKLAINADAKTAVAGPAIWGRNLIQQTLPQGLAFPVAHCATVPLGGFLLGGGFGLNGDEWSTMSCFAVRGAQVITAAGDLIQVDARKNPDWFWALRGAGNGFPGVVAQFDLQLFDAPPKVMASTYVFPGTRIGEVAQLAEDIAHQSPPDTEILGIGAIGGQDASGRNQVICALRVAVFATEPDQARSVLDPIARHPLVGGALMKMEATTSDWEGMFLDSIDASRGFGFGRYAVDSLWTHSARELMPLIAEQLASSPSRHSHAVVQFKVKTSLPEDAALSRIAPAYAGLYSVWREPAQDAAAQAWLRSSMRALQPFAQGHYINEIDAEAVPSRVSSSFSLAAWRKLLAMRRRVDRDGVFQDFFGASNLT